MISNFTTKINSARLLVLMLAFLFFGTNIIAQKIYVADTTLTHKERKEAKKEFEREQFRASKTRIVIKGDYVFANLNTNITFTGPNEILSANIGLESNMGLPDKRGFFSGSLLYRFTKSSGLYMQYYGINRSESKVTDRDYIFMGDTIKAGTLSTAYFNTQVFSLGYIFTVLQRQKSYMGVYFNVYSMNVKTGINSGVFQENVELNTLLPLPNFGLVGHYEILKWFGIGGNIGFFALNLDSFSGHVASLNFEASFKPIDWLAFSVMYQTFDVYVDFPEDNYNASVEYFFHGPSLGVTLIF